MSNNPHNSPAYLHLLKSFQRTKTHLSIANLNVIHLTKNPDIFSVFLRKLTKKLQTTKNLKSLTLDLKGVQLHQENIKDLYKDLLKELPDLENLKIILCPQTHYQNQYFEILFKALQRFRSLRRFQLTISNQPARIPLSSRLQTLTKALKKSAPRLQDVKFNFHDGVYTSLWATNFPKLDKWGMKRLGYLRSLTLSLPSSVLLDTITDVQEGRLDLSALRRLNRLKSLDVTLVEVVDDFNGGISNELTFDPVRLFPNLKRFKCGVLYSRPTSSKGLELCASEIASRLSYLEDFGLRFKQNSELTDQEIQRTTQCLASLNSNLHYLSLVFRLGKLTSSGAIALIAALSSPRLRNMQTLSLEFLNCKGTNNGFIARLGETIERNMNDIRSLRLRFDYHESYSSSFTRNVLAIVGYEGVTDRAINNLGVSLSKGCLNLELLSLEFGSYSQISDKGVKSLCECLSKIESLKKVWLKFRFCPEVSESLHKTFQPTQNHLTITDKDKLDPKLFSSFLLKITKKLQTTKNLKGLTLDLGNAQLGSRNVKDLSRGLFNKLYNLENLKIILTDYTNPWFFKVLRGSRNLRSFEIRISGAKREDLLKHQLTDLIP